MIMGCFGDTEPVKNVQTTENSNQTKTLDPALYSAAMSNVNWLNQARDAGYTPFQGQLTAGLTSDEQSAGGMIRALAGGSNPYTSTLEGAYTGAATAPAYQVGTQRVVDDVGGAGGSTQDYMNPYLQGVLDPALRELEKSKEINLRDLGLKSALGGAFGDARTGFEAANYRNLSDLAKVDTTTKGYSDAFDRAMALKTSDLARMLGADTTNANLSETALMRALTGGQALQGLDKYNTGRSLDLATALGQYGGTERNVKQAGLDAALAEYMKKYQYPLDVAKVSSGAVASLAPSLTSTTGSKTGTEITSAPNNTGWEIIGALAGALV